MQIPDRMFETDSFRQNAERELEEWQLDPFQISSRWGEKPREFTYWKNRFYKGCVGLVLLPIVYIIYMIIPQIKSYLVPFTIAIIICLLGGVQLFARVVTRCAGQQVKFWRLILADHFRLNIVDNRLLIELTQDELSADIARIVSLHRDAWWNKPIWPSMPLGQRGPDNRLGLLCEYYVGICQIRNLAPFPVSFAASGNSLRARFLKGMWLAMLKLSVADAVESNIEPEPATGHGSEEGTGWG